MTARRRSDPQDRQIPLDFGPAPQPPLDFEPAPQPPLSPPEEPDLMDMARAHEILAGLLQRLDHDARSPKPLFGGMASDLEREALRTVLAGGKQPTNPASKAPAPTEDRPRGSSPPAVDPAALLRLERPPNQDWILCLDFGTAKSKAFAATRGGETDEPDLMEIPLGALDRDLDNSVYAVSSSVWIDDDGRMFAGSEAIRRSQRRGGANVDPARKRLDSLKQEMSQTTPESGFEKTPLDPAVNPTTTRLTFEDALTFYLAYLTDLATTHVAQKCGTRYVRRRFTLPGWKSEHREWAAGMIARWLGRAQFAADSFHERWRDGIPAAEVRDVLRRASEHDDRLAWLVARRAKRDAKPLARQGAVLEALAAASGRVWRDGNARALMLVVDVGAGTTDLSLFWVVQGERGRRAFPVAPGDKCIRQAGDHLDSSLVAELLRRADPGGDPELTRRLTADLYLRGVRRLKETLLMTGRVEAELVDDRRVSISKEDFLALDGVRKFESEIHAGIESLLASVHESCGAMVKNERLTLVLTGGGCDLPMIQGLRNARWSIGDVLTRCQVAKRVPDLVADQMPSEFSREYPQLAVALGGALPTLLDERDMLVEWHGNAPAPGGLTRYATRGG